MWLDDDSPTPSESETLASYRPPPPPSCNYRNTERFDWTTADQENLQVIVQDAHDTTGEGMAFSLSASHSFKNIFDAFKAASCQSCRPTEGIRFKVNGQRLKEADTPMAVTTMPRISTRARASMLTLLQQLEADTALEYTISIRAYSNSPGLRCSACQKSGYPTTKGKEYDGNFPLPQLIKPTGHQLIQLLFQDFDGKITGVPVTKSYQMKHAMIDHALRNECDVRLLHFFFDGERIADEDTPAEVSDVLHSISS